MKKQTNISSEGLSTTTIVGIAIGTIIGSVAIGGRYYYYKKKQDNYLID